MFRQGSSLVRQSCSLSHVEFDDESVADFFDEQVDAGRRPDQFARIWIHTHPGDCPQPSLTDEETFARVFGRADWAVMFILAKEGDFYGRLRFNVGPGGEQELPVSIDYSQPFAGSNRDAWEDEYFSKVEPLTSVPIAVRNLKQVMASRLEDTLDAEWYENWREYSEDYEPTGGFTA